MKHNISSYNKILQKLIRNAKKTYYYLCFTKYKNDLKNTWITIKDILNKKSNNKHNFPEHFKIDGSTVSDKETIANKFNLFFCNIGPNVANNIGNIIEHGSFKNYLNSPCSDVSNFKPVEEADVIKIIDYFSAKNSCGIDKNTTKLLKTITPYITKSITFIINQSLASGVFPDKLKSRKLSQYLRKMTQHFWTITVPYHYFRFFIKYLSVSSLTNYIITLICTICTLKVKTVLGKNILQNLQF